MSTDREQMWLPGILSTPAIEAVPANPKHQLGEKKVPLHLVPPALTVAAAEGLAEGAEKYTPFSWRSTRTSVSLYLGAIARHLAAYQDGEDLDPDSTTGKSHLAGIAASLAILLDAGAHGTLVDDRVKGPGGQLILKYRPKEK